MAWGKEVSVQPSIAYPESDRDTRDKHGMTVAWLMKSSWNLLSPRDMHGHGPEEEVLS